jgi:hypothetical protein
MLSVYGSFYVRTMNFYFFFTLIRPHLLRRALCHLKPDLSFEITTPVHDFIKAFYVCFFLYIYFLMFGVEQEAYVLVNINGCRPPSNPTVSHYAMVLSTAVAIRT